MIEILMATYNGEKYIREQIDSLFAQTDTGWTLTIQDDCSGDQTLRLLEEYQRDHPEKIRIINNCTKFGSAKANFFSLLAQSTGEYVMLCDQDDVWKKDKIERSLAKIKKMEEGLQKGTPILVHTDLSVTDESLKIISASLFQMQKMNEKRISLQQLLVQNIVTGCTAIINRPLINMLIFPISGDIIMHDWWLALIACCFGKIGFVEKPTVLYRQHGDNNVGAKNPRSFGYKLRLILNFKHVRRNIADTYQQAAELLFLYDTQLNDKQKSLLSQYINLPCKNKLKRIATAWRLGTVKNGFIPKLASILYL